MKLGVSYIVFNGEELLKFAIASIRPVVDFISVIYQTTSYFGNLADPMPVLNQIKGIDQLIHFESDLAIPPQQNELKIRNLGRQLSINAGCSHHISADTDEFYDKDQLAYAKTFDCDMSLAYMDLYYKEPTFLVYPASKMMVSFIHPADNEYDIIPKYPFPIDITRRLKKFENFKVFTRQEVTIHHMSYVRKNIRGKLVNTCNGKNYNIDKFVQDFHTYKLGDKVCLLPDFINRRTIEVENKFNINIWQEHQ